MGGRTGTGAVALAAGLLLASCGTAPPYRAVACGAPPAPVPAADGRTRTASLSVLTFNIEGLGWPARATRAGELREIGARLSALRAAGRAPDVVLFQEMFSGDAKRAVAATGYPAIVTGPRRTSRARDPVAAPLPGRARLAHGEAGVHLTGSGLAVASRFPVIASDREPFGTRACAGLDCLSNKGVMLARIAVPGVPVPVDVYDTHLNSRRASRAPAERTLAAHGRQVQAVAAFINRTRGADHPVILGGDFNMRHSDARWRAFSSYGALSLVQRVCADPASGCDVHATWTGDAPWLETEDLQFFGGGRTVAIRPVRVEALFDGGQGGPVLSDHVGYLVTYRLNWAADVAAGPC